MILPVFIAVVILLLVIIGVAIWLIRKRGKSVKNGEKAKPVTNTGVTLAFRWRYIALPLFLLLLALIMTVFFYWRLPAEVAYRFETDGSAESWSSRGVIVASMLGAQLFLSLLAVIIVRGISKISAFFRQPERTLVQPESIITLMGNMVALPQIILVFAMLDIFSYNSYQIHLLPLWVFAIIVMLLGMFIMGGLFIRVLMRSLARQR